MWTVIQLNHVCFIYFICATIIIIFCISFCLTFPCTSGFFEVLYFSVVQGDLNCDLESPSWHSHSLQGRRFYWPCKGEKFLYSQVIKHFSECENTCGVHIMKNSSGWWVTFSMLKLFWKNLKARSSIGFTCTAWHCSSGRCRVQYVPAQFQPWVSFDN